MKCPFCGNEMKEGTLHSGGRYVQWKGVDAEGRKEEYLLAKSDRQLGICLRMLYDEGYRGLVVESVINAKNRMEFHVKVMADEDKMAKLNDRYQTLIS